MNTITLKNGLSLSVQYNASKTGNAMATVASVGKDGKHYPITSYGTAANITTLIELVQQGILQQVVAELVKRGDTTLEKRNAAIQKITAPIEEVRTTRQVEVKRGPGRPRKITAESVAPAPVQAAPVQTPSLPPEFIAFMKQQAAINEALMKAISGE